MLEPIFLIFIFDFQLLPTSAANHPATNAPKLLCDSPGNSDHSKHPRCYKDCTHDHGGDDRIGLLFTNPTRYEFIHANFLMVWPVGLCGADGGVHRRSLGPSSRESLAAAGTALGMQVLALVSPCTCSCPLPVPAWGVLVRSLAALAFALVLVLLLVLLGLL